MIICKDLIFIAFQYQMNIIVNLILIVLLILYFKNIFIGTWDEDGEQCMGKFGGEDCVISNPGGEDYTKEYEDLNLDLYEPY